MIKKITGEYYKMVGKELASLGIYIKPEDVYILVKIVLKNLLLVLKNNGDEVYVDRSASIKKNKKDNIIIKHNNRLLKIPRRLQMTDRSSQKILEHIFLPMLMKESED